MPDQVNDTTTTSTTTTTTSVTQATIQATDLNVQEEETRWETASAFQKKSGEEAVFNSLYGKDYAKQDLKGLVSALETVGRSRSKVFSEMLNALKELLRLTEIRGKETKEQREIRYDFRKTLSDARQLTQRYLNSRRDRVHVRESGKRRLDIAERVAKLLGEMQAEVEEKVSQLPEKRQRMLRYQEAHMTEEQIEEAEKLVRLDEKGLDLLMVIRTGEFGPTSELDEEEESEQQKEWFLGEYSEELKELLLESHIIDKKEDEKVAEDKKNRFLGFLMSKNNRLMANKLVVSLLADSARASKVTLGMPWLKESLQTYLGTAIDKKEYLELEPQDFQTEVLKKIEKFETEHRAEIQKAGERRTKVLELMGLNAETNEERALKAVYAHPRAAELFETEKDADFQTKIDELRHEISERDKLIDEVLAQKFSSVTRPAVKQKLCGQMPALRLFGEREHVMNALDQLLGNSLYYVPEEYETESRLDHLLGSLKIQTVLKDGFVDAVTGGQPETFRTMDEKTLKSKGKAFVEKFKANEKLLSVKVPEDAQLTEAAWKELDGLRKEMGKLGTDECVTRIDTILHNQDSSAKMTREEFRTRRIFETEDEKKFRKDRKKKEEGRIRDVSAGCSEIFSMLLRKDAEDPLAHFRKVEGIYRIAADEKKQKKRKKNDPQKMLEDARKAELKAMFDGAQISEQTYLEYEKKLQDMISRLLDTGAGLHTDIQAENRRKNLEAFGVESWEGAMQRLRDYLSYIKGDNAAKPAELAKAEQHYDAALDQIKEYDGGKFGEIAEIILAIPEVRNVVKSGNADRLKELLDGTIKEKFTPLMETIRAYVKASENDESEDPENYGIALCKQYVYTYRSEIFSGQIKAEDHATRLQQYRQKLNNTRVKANLKLAESAIIAELKKIPGRYRKGTRFRLKADEDAQIRMLQYRLQTLAKDTAHFEDLLDPQEVKKWAVRLWNDKEMLRRRDPQDPSSARMTVEKKRVRKDAADVKEKLQTEKAAEMANARKESVKFRKKIGDAVSKGRTKRTECLGLDGRAIRRVRQGKSLIRTHDLGAEGVSQNRTLSAKARGALAQEIMQFPQELPQVLKDALIEEASRDGYTDEFVKQHSRHPSHGKLYRHADVMQQLYRSLIEGAKDVEAMTEEEAQMFIVHLYGQRWARSRLFDAKSAKNGQLVEMKTVRESEDYKSFRENYRKLKEFEELSLSEPSLALEQADMSRDLRILLITDIGLAKEAGSKKQVEFRKLKKDEERKGYFDSIGATIEKQRRYLEYSAVITEQIRKKVEEFHRKQDEGKAQKTTAVLIENEVRALREYYMSEIVEQFETDYWADLEQRRQQSGQQPGGQQPPAQQQSGAQPAAQPQDTLLERINKDSWLDKIERDYWPDKTATDPATAPHAFLRQELLFQKSGISLADVDKEESRRVSAMNNAEYLLANAIRSSAAVFRGRQKRYEKLDVDQRKFFALALVMMDASALGENTQGTAALLTSQEKKQAEASGISAEIQKYIRGEAYDIDVDYWEAYYKLTDFYDPALQEYGYEVRINTDAFNKAMAFAQKLFAEKQAYQRGEKDMERMGDGYSSILSAFLYGGKTQQNEVEKLSGVTLSKEDVLSRLIAYAEKDQVSKAKVVAGAAFAATGTAMIVGAGVASDVHIAQAKKEARQAAEKAGEDAGEEVSAEDLQAAEESAQRTDTQEGVDAAVGVAGYAVTRIGAKATKESVERYHKMSGILRRLKKLNDDPEQLKMLLILLQDRTLLDKSVTDPEQFVSQDERDVLFNALTGDITGSGEAMSGFDTDEACHQALASAMSFQLRDDMFFKDKEITAEHFAEGALKRTTTIDWDLLDRAFQFIDAVRERRATILATSRASDFIEQSGNKAAIRELHALESEYKDKKAEFTLDKIEDKLKQQMESATTALVTEDVEVQRAWDGYLSLSPQEKNLFYKVLQRRDLLDISKKDYVVSFFGVSDRNYLNPAGRSELLNEFIRSSLGDGAGVQLDETAYYEAMRSLLSTQVSDRVDFTDRKNLSGKMTGVFSYERFFIMGRGTAIDWKLFKRALNFVNRAASELRTQEGNALLYQGAGDLEANGMIDVDYSFLRRNFHKTGNQWTRFAARLALKRVKKEVKFDETLGILVGAANAVTAGLERAGFQDYAVGKGMAKVAGVLNRTQEISDMVGADTIFVGFEDVRTKEEQEAKDEEDEKARQKKELRDAMTPEQREAAEKEEEEEEEKKKKEEEEKEAQRRKDLMFLGQMKEGFDLILANKRDIQAAFMEMNTFLTEQVQRYFGSGPELVEAEADESNIVTQKVGAHVDAAHGDARDTLEQIGPKALQLQEFWLHLDEIPFAANLKQLMIYGIERAVYRSVLDGDFMDKEIYHDADGNAVELSRDDEVAALREQATKFVREKVEVLAESVFGKEGVAALKSAETEIFNCQGYINDALGYYTKYFTFAKSCVEHTESIVQSASHIRKLKVAKKAAKERAAEDDQKLMTGREEGRLTAREAQKATGGLERNRAMAGLSEEIATAVQAFGIAEDVVSMACDAVNTFAGTMNYGMSFVSKAIEDGLEFVMFATRVLTDRLALQEYYFTTKDGKAALARLKRGMNDPKHSKHAQENASRMSALEGDYSFSLVATSANMVDIIADMQGYEHTSELVEDVGMNMAQSLVFSASKFNPMMQTKMMAMTVMLVMGLDKEEIGDTSPETVKKLFESFKMAR